MMEASLSLFFVVLVIAPTAVQPTYDDVCIPVHKMLELIKSTIDYASFCAETQYGGDKLACRIDGLHDSFGFLVCREPMVGLNKPCRNFINDELNNLKKLKKAGIKTVGFFPQRIDDVRCGDSRKITCSGFVENWVTNEKGIHGHIRLAIADKLELDLLIKKVIISTTRAGGSLHTTAKDLYKIRKYMRMRGNTDLYRQICDLQGFFLKAGGFQVSDTEGIKEKLALNDICGISDTSGEREPTTEKVLKALKYMSNKFKAAHAQNFPKVKHIK